MNRDYMFFVIGVNTGFRISDILKLKVIHVKGQTHITIREKKTNKEKKAFINALLRKEIDRYIQDMREDEYLFQSQKGVNKPITRVQAYRILNEATIEIGLAETGTHTTSVKLLVIGITRSIMILLCYRSISTILHHQLL
ncbi:MAG: tyrosine-type recombinase/integrase [Caulobacteraceae bacterium]